ncbi:MAG TPA: hypothetical protein OIM65_03055 [Bacilli bacterium]|nr:hypothetical protein [Bacilli bacterium]
MEENKKIKNIKLTLYIIGILCLMVGVSYATYNLVLKGNKQHQINIGSLTLTYEETNNINVTGDTIKTDEEGIASGNVFNFKVSVNNTTNKEINYIVYLTMDIEYLNNIDKGKVYLNNKTKNIVYGPSFISDLAKYKYEDSYVLCTNIFTNATETHEYSLTSWISPKTNIFESGGTRQTIIGGTVKFKVSVETVEITNLDTSGANKPVLASNMIPVYYDEANSVWKKADKNNSQKDYRWYSYTSTGEYKGMWANAVTVKEANRQTYLNATPGTTISMDDITTMWVWIPRFNAVTPSNYNGGTQSKPNAIDVTFVKQNETAIDAFTFGNKELSGFWYGKFEIGGSLASSCTNETCNVSNIVVKPNVSSLRSQKVSSFFYASRSMEQAGNSFGFVNSEVDTHMSKNNEWGAVAYLTQSIYGRCTSSTTCTEIGINNNSSYITGYGAPAGSSSSVTNGTYNTALGKDASTTGTIYGIYDMSGGAYEYVMGVYNNAKSSSGFNSLPDEKYYNNYTGSSYTGHALTETKKWYGDNDGFVSASYPWFARGGYYGAGGVTGVFYFSSYDGNYINSHSSHLVISNE